MVRKCLVAGLALLGVWSCASGPVAPPAYFVESIPSDVSTQLSLDDRITVREAWDAMKAGRIDQAAKLIARLGPGNPLYAVGTAYVDLLRGDLEAAEEGFAAAIEADPAMTPARVGLAQIYESRREREKVFTECREILKRDPENRWAKPRFEALREDLVRERTNEGNVAMAAGDREAAKTAYLTVLFYDPDDANAHINLLTIYLDEDNLENALVHLRYVQALEEKGALSRERTTRLYRRLADLFYEKGDLGRSLESYEKLRELDPRDNEALQRIAELKGRLGIIELPSQYAEIPALDVVTREDLAALIGVKFERFLEAPGGRTEILVDISLSWAQRYIVRVASLDIMGAFENHTFQPKRIINRAELADTVVRLIAVLQARGAKLVPLVEERRIQVADVPQDYRYYQAIIRALAFQVMSLTPDRMFEPERTVSGEEAVRVLDLIRDLAK